MWGWWVGRLEVQGSSEQYIPFFRRISLNKHFLENHDVEAIPCVYCVRLILKDRIQQHLRNEHPHMSHMCTECGRECIYPSALKQHIKGRTIHSSLPPFGICLRRFFSLYPVCLHVPLCYFILPFVRNTERRLAISIPIVCVTKNESFAFCRFPII